MYRTVFSNNSWIIAALVFAMSCKHVTEDRALPYYNNPDFSPLFLDNQEASRLVSHHLADFSLIDQDGRQFSKSSLAGRIHVADFIFTSCGGICPTMTTQMARVGKAFENDSSVMILSYSVTPWIDTPEKLKKYKQDHGIANPNWYFLTGQKATIYNLARTSYFAEESLGYTKDSSQFLHTEHFVLVDAQQRIRGIYNGTLQLEAEQLIRDIGVLKKEMNL